MTDFHAHGGTYVETRGRVLVYRSQTHLNREEVRRLEKETGERVGAFEGRRWAVLRLVDKPVLLTPDAEDAARKAVAHMATVGLSAQAVAFLSQEDRAMVEEQTARIIGEVIPLKFFDEPADAEAWLNSVIAGE